MEGKSRRGSQAQLWRDHGISGKGASIATLFDKWANDTTFETTRHLRINSQTIQENCNWSDWEV